MSRVSFEARHHDDSGASAKQLTALGVISDSSDLQKRAETTWWAFSILPEQQLTLKGLVAPLVLASTPDAAGWRTEQLRHGVFPPYSPARADERAVVAEQERRALFDSHTCRRLRPGEDERPSSDAVPEIARQRMVVG